jgi:hypothetical protein
MLRCPKSRARNGPALKQRHQTRGPRHSADGRARIVEWPRSPCIVRAAVRTSRALAFRALAPSMSHPRRGSFRRSRRAVLSPIGVTSSDAHCKFEDIEPIGTRPDGAFASMITTHPPGRSCGLAARVDEASAWENSWNSFASCSAVMPMPVSMMASSTQSRRSASLRARRVTSLAW